MNTMEHKGFAARVEYSEENGCFIGHVAGVSDVIGFHGERVVDLRAAFNEAVDDYLATCKKYRSPDAAQRNPGKRASIRGYAGWA